MKAGFVLPLVAAALVGCSQIAPSGRPAVEVKRTDSRSVSVTAASIESEAGGAVVAGYLSKNVRADSTASAHLDIHAFDAQGTRVAEQVMAFVPGEIPGRFRGVGGRVRFRVRLNFPLGSVASIEVRAHEGDHALH